MVGKEGLLLVSRKNAQNAQKQRNCLPANEREYEEAFL